jgi:3-hydroxyisobutyrate dehydrogenase-like beta-hydroxyacid dehydrogenase
MGLKPRKNIGIIGTGIIGSRVAAALRSEGFHVFVWNRTPRAQPNFLSSPAKLAGVCEVVQIFVSDAQAVFDSISGLSDALTPQHTVVCSSTIGPEATLEAAKMVRQKGARFLDAPFTGSKFAAERRELVYFVGGDDATFQIVEPALQASGKSIVRVGDIGQAATVKLATNMLAAVTVQTLAEALALVTKSGIEPEVLALALEQHPVRSSVLDMKLTKMLHGAYDPHFSMKNMFKDVQLAIHMANALDVEIPATTVTAGVMFGGLNRGWGDLDFAALAKIYDFLAAKAKPASSNGGIDSGSVVIEGASGIGEASASVSRVEKMADATLVSDGPAGWGAAKQKSKNLVQRLFGV